MGPSGWGPMTGRRLGYCAGFNAPGFMGRGLGLGRGRGFGFGRGLRYGRGMGIGMRMGFGRGWGRGRAWGDSYIDQYCEPDPYRRY